MDAKKLDINVATLDDFESLIGIGHAKAEAIIEARKGCGRFSSISDLVKIPGIGPGLLEQNMGKLTCSSAVSSASLKSGSTRRCERETRSTAFSKSVVDLMTPNQSANFEDRPSTSTSGVNSHDAGGKGKSEPSRPRTDGGVSTRTRAAELSKANNIADSSDNEECNSDSNGEQDGDELTGSSEGGSSPSSPSSSHTHEGMDCSDYNVQSPLVSERGEQEDEEEEDDDYCEEDGEVRSLRSRIPVPQSALEKYWMKRKCVGEEVRGLSPGKKQCRSPDSSDSEPSLGAVMRSSATSSSVLRKSRIPSRSNPSPELLEWIKTFQDWSNAERLVALDSLIEVCDPTQVRHLMAVIEPQFQRDFISLLPKELALYVLSFLEPKDLLKAAQTCRYWRILAEDNLLWREKCREESIDESLVFGGRLRKKAGIGNKSPWKALYLRQKVIEHNWRVSPIRSPKVLKGHDDHVITCLEFSGSRIVSGSDDNTLKVWSAITGKCLRTLVGHTGGVWSSQMQGHIIISGSTDRTLKVWNADTGQCMHTLYGHTSTVRCMHLYKNKVVSGSRDATLRLWDIDSGQCLHVLMGHVAAVRCVQYDGRRVVSGAYDYMVKVWDPESETCLYTLQGHTNRVYSLQFDGVHIVSGSLDTSIRVWDVETGNCLHTLIGHQSLTSGMELKDNILVSGNADSTVKVWDITTGQCLQTLQGSNKHQSAVTCLQFNKRFVITSSDDGTVKIWDLRTGEFLRNLVALDSGGSGGVVWRIRCSNTKLVCAVGSRNGTEETKLLVLDFDADDQILGLGNMSIVKRNS